MARIEVDPGQLQAAGGRQAAVAQQVAGLCGPLAAAGDTAAGAASEPAAAAAIADCAGAWTVSLDLLAQSVGGLAANVGAAGSAYLLTDTTAIGGGP